MSKKTGKPKRPKSASHTIKTISNPIIFDSASVRSETVPIKVGPKAKKNNQISEKDRTHSLSTFSIDSDISMSSGISSSSSAISESEAFDTSSISSESGISSGRTTPTASVTTNDSSAFDTSSISNESRTSSDLKPTLSKKVAVNGDTSQRQSGQQKFAGLGRGGRKAFSQGAPGKVEIPTVPTIQEGSAVLKKKFPQTKSKSEQTKKEVEQTVSLDDQIKALQSRQSNLQQKLTKLNQQSRSFIFIKSKEHRTKERELNSQLKEVMKAKWKVELDKKFESDKGSGVLYFINRPHCTSDPDNKYLKEIDKIIQKHPQQYRHYTCNDRNDFLNSRSFVYKSLQEILERANPTYEDKQILLRYDAYQVKILLQSGDVEEKEDKKALKEIHKDLKNEMSKSRKSFDSKNDQYICKLRKGRGASPDSIMQSVQTEQQLQQISRS